MSSCYKPESKASIEASKEANPSNYYPWDIRFQNTFKKWERPKIQNPDTSAYFTIFHPTSFEDQRIGFYPLVQEVRKPEVIIHPITNEQDEGTDMKDYIDNPSNVLIILNKYSPHMRPICQNLRSIKNSPGGNGVGQNSNQGQAIIQNIISILNIVSTNEEEPTPDYITSELLNILKYIKPLAVGPIDMDLVTDFIHKLGSFLDNIQIPTNEQIAINVDAIIAHNGAAVERRSTEIQSRVSAALQVRSLISYWLGILGYPRPARI